MPPVHSSGGRHIPKKGNMSQTTCQTRNSFLLQESLRENGEGGRKTKDWAEGRGEGIYKIMVVGTCEGSKEEAGIYKRRREVEGIYKRRREVEGIYKMIGEGPGICEGRGRLQESDRSAEIQGGVITVRFISQVGARCERGVSGLRRLHREMLRCSEQLGIISRI